jgi:HPt (histidine-containing phosphotransfer) domain-containing protein
VTGSPDDGPVAPAGGPVTVSPDGPATVVPDGPVTVVPDGPVTVVPDGPVTVVPDGPVTVVPDGPVTVTADGPGPADPAVPPALVSLLDELDDTALVESIVRTYLRELPRRVDALKHAVAAGSVDALSPALHLLKSTSAAVGALALAELCASLERDAHTDAEAAAIDLTPIDLAVTQVEQDLATAISHLDPQ